MESPKSLKTKQKIIDTALVLFKENEYDAVTIEQICSVGGIVKNTFYYHFKSKEALFIDCIGSQKGLSLNDLSEILLSDESHFEKFWLMQEPRFEFIQNCGPEIMQYVCRIPADRLLELMDDEADVHQVEITLLNKAKEVGEIRNSADTAVLLGIARTQLLGSLSLWLASGARYSFLEIVRAGFEAIFDTTPELRKGNPDCIRIDAIQRGEDL